MPPYSLSDELQDELGRQSLQMAHEHGFVGLGLYLLLGFLIWRTGSWIIRNTRKLEGYQWAYSLATMIQVSLVGFSVGGAFLSLLYFDVPYYLMSAMVVTRVLVEKELKRKALLAGQKGAGTSRQHGQLNPVQAQPITQDAGGT